MKRIDGNICKIVSLSLSIVFSTYFIPLFTIFSAYLLTYDASAG